MASQRQLVVKGSWRPGTVSRLAELVQPIANLTAMARITIPTKPAMKITRRVRVRRMISPCLACSAENTGPLSSSLSCRPSLMIASFRPLAHSGSWHTTIARQVRFRLHRSRPQKKGSQAREEGTLSSATGLGRLRPSQPGASHVRCQDVQWPEQTHVHDGLCFGGGGDAACEFPDESCPASVRKASRTARLVGGFNAYQQTDLQSRARQSNQPA